MTVNLDVLKQLVGDRTVTDAEVVAGAVVAAAPDSAIMSPAMPSSVSVTTLPTVVI